MWNLKSTDELTRFQIILSQSYRLMLLVLSLDRFYLPFASCLFFHISMYLCWRTHLFALLILSPLLLRLHSPMNIKRTARLLSDFKHTAFFSLPSHPRLHKCTFLCGYFALCHYELLRRLEMSLTNRRSPTSGQRLISPWWIEWKNVSYLVFPTHTSADRSATAHESILNCTFPLYRIPPHFLLWQEKHFTIQHSPASCHLQTCQRLWHCFYWGLAACWNEMGTNDTFLYEAVIFGRGKTELINHTSEFDWVLFFSMPIFK